MEILNTILCNIEIKRVSDGVLVIIAEDLDFVQWHAGVEPCVSTYIWEEGNYSCDCNRAIFFNRAQGQETDIDERQCGDGGYIVRITEAESGEVLYDEF